MRTRKYYICLTTLNLNCMVKYYTVIECNADVKSLFLKHTSSKTMKTYEKYLKHHVNFI